MSQIMQISKSYLLNPLGSIEAYVQNVNAFPVLTPEEEKELFVRLQNNGDLLAAEQLVLSHLRYVVRIAHNYKGYGLAFSDLVQEGSIGLMKAVKRFDLSVGVRLVSFAVHWIKSEIHNFVIKNWRIVKVATTKAQRKLFFNLRRQKQRLGWFTREEVNAVAQDLGVSTKDVLEMESRLNAHDMSFDLEETEDEPTWSPTHYLKSADLDPLEALEGHYTQEDNHQKLSVAFAQLDGRSQDIVQQRWLAPEKAGLKVLADKYQVSMERIRQIENAAMKKIKTAFLFEDAESL